MKTASIAAAVISLAAFSAPVLADNSNEHHGRSEHKAQQAQPKPQKSAVWSERRTNDARSDKKPRATSREHPSDKQPKHVRPGGWDDARRDGRHDGGRDDYRGEYHGGRPPRRDGYPAPRGHRHDYHARHPRPRPYYNPYAWQPPRYFHEPRHSVYFAYDLAWDQFGLNVERAIYEHGHWVLFGFSAFHGPLQVIVDSASGVLLGYHPYYRRHH